MVKPNKHGACNPVNRIPPHFTDKIEFFLEQRELEAVCFYRWVNTFISLVALPLFRSLGQGIVVKVVAWFRPHVQSYQIHVHTQVRNTYIAQKTKAKALGNLIPLLLSTFSPLLSPTSQWVENYQNRRTTDVKPRKLLAKLSELNNVFWPALLASNLFRLTERTVDSFTSTIGIVWWYSASNTWPFLDIGVKS